MSKKAKILILLSVIFFLLILYLLITAEPVKKMDLTDNKFNTSQLERLTNNYQEQAGVIIANYLKLLKDDSYNLDQVKQIKDKLLELKVPTIFKNLHIDLVLALTKMENFLLEGKEPDKIESQRIINQIKADYSWLNY